MAAFKNELSAAVVEQLGSEIAAAWTSFDEATFVNSATRGLEARELKERVQLISDALEATMPGDPTDAARVIRSVLDAGGLQGWSSLPVNSFIASAMIDRPAVGLPLLADLTPRLSAEFAVRFFIDEQYDVTMRQLGEWVGHPDEHVRRLVSEGTRPRLPWAPVLRRFVADPAPTLRLLDRLFDDPSEYVRRSVANHLNDISKDHPDLAVETATRWAPRSTHGDFVLRHGLRSLVKRGDPAALRVLGFDPDVAIELIELSCSPPAIRIGDTITIEFGLRAVASTRAAVDYIVAYQGVHGRKAGKVFKLTVRDLPAAEVVRFERRHRFDHVSIRRIHPGPHRVDIQVNGRVLAGIEFDVAD